MIAMRWTKSLKSSTFLAFALAVIAPAPADPHQLVVPLFRDDGGNLVNSVPDLGGVAGFVTVRNLRDETIVMYLVYSQMDPAGEAVVQQAVSFRLGAFRVVNFRPVQDDPVENVGRGVPNMLPGLGAEGSLQIIWIGGPEMVQALIGRYQQLSAANEFAHVLL
jgi:hypothetical protein